MKSKLILTILILVIPVAASQVTYDMETSTNEANLSADIELDCNRFNCPQLTWGKPSGYEVVNITDSEGEITDYQETSEQIEVDTGSPHQGNTKILTINFRTEEDAEEIYEGLYKRRVSLSGFNDEDLQGQATTNNLISGDIGYGFQTSYADNEFNFTGQGPINIDVNFGEGKETEYYSFFGQAPDYDTSEAYEISVGTTGQLQNYEKIPVAVMPPEVYNSTQTTWSSGEYSSGTIRMRDNEKDEFKPTLARETVHALNDDFFDWDKTSSSYIDEGTSEFVGYLMERRQVPTEDRDEQVRQIFGEDLSYTTTIDGQRYRITKPSRGDKEVLWNYYQQDAEFMKTWKPSDAEYRSFGYAYSELIVRHNLVEKDVKLSELYQYFESDQEISRPEDKWSLLSEELDLTPCKTENRTEFNKCLEQINNHSNFQAYTAEPESSNDKLVINETETPEYNETDDSIGTNITVPGNIDGRESFQSFVQNLVNYVVDSLLNLISNN